uniref:Uncharacterized protein n=1 Tax=Rhizophora mucronata TaxID=61149 RepID=A0A2P2P328_RHIMU
MTVISRRTCLDIQLHGQ